MRVVSRDDCGNQYASQRMFRPGRGSWGVLLTAVLAAGVLATSGTAAPSATLTVQLVPGAVSAGEPALAVATFHNVSGVTLPNARVTLALPEGPLGRGGSELRQGHRDDPQRRLRFRRRAERPHRPGLRQRAALRPARTERVDQGHLRASRRQRDGRSRSSRAPRPRCSPRRTRPTAGAAGRCPTSLTAVLDHQITSLPSPSPAADEPQASVHAARRRRQPGPAR